MKQPGIYQIQSKIKPERIYIGSSMLINDRWKIHLIYLRRGDHHSPKLQNHYNKYGENDLVFSIIEPCMADWLLIREQYYIDNLKPWFNISPKAGSCKGIIRSKEFSQKLSQRMKGKKYMLGKTLSNDAKKRISIANKGRLLGKKQSAEHINMRVQKTKGLIRTPEVREKLSKALKGRIFSEETKKKISIQATDRYKKHLHPCIGKICSEETRQKISARNKGRTGGWNKGITRTEEEKRIQSEKMKGRYAGDKNPNYGRHLTFEQKAKMSEYVKQGLLKKKEREGQNLKIA